MHLQSANFNNLIIRAITGFIYGSLFWTIFLLLPPVFFSLFLGVIFAVILWSEWPKIVPITSIKGIFFTTIYLIVPLALMIVANHTNHTVLGLLFILVMIHDTSAYLTGLYFGKDLLCPSISPKKTWQGFMGGVFALFLIITFLRGASITPIQLIQIMAFSLIFSLIATAGDLFESWLKRQAHIKDSGNSLPGHGGFLDRFDSVIFIIVTYYLLKPILYLL